MQIAHCQRALNSSREVFLRAFFEDPIWNNFDEQTCSLFLWTGCWTYVGLVATTHSITCPGDVVPVAVDAASALTGWRLWRRGAVNIDDVIPTGGWNSRYSLSWWRMLWRYNAPSPTVCGREHKTLLRTCRLSCLSVCLSVPLSVLASMK